MGKVSSLACALWLKNKTHLSGWMVSSFGGLLDCLVRQVTLHVTVTHSDPVGSKESTLGGQRKQVLSQNLNHVCASDVMFVVSFPSLSVLLGRLFIIATNYFEGNLNYFLLPLSSLLLLLGAAVLSLVCKVFVDTTRP